MNVDYPFRYDNVGRTASTELEDHVRDMIELILLTSPGERVMMPDFGSGLLAMTYEPSSPEIASALQFTMQASLQRWLGDVIDVRRVEVDADDSTLRIVVEYSLQQTAEVHRAAVERRAS